MWPIACYMHSLPPVPFTYVNNPVNALQINRVADCMLHAILATGSIHLREWNLKRNIVAAGEETGNDFF